MFNEKYVKAAREVADNYDAVCRGLLEVADSIDAVRLYNPQPTMFSLVRLAEVNTVKLRNLAARTVSGEPGEFQSEISSLLGIRVEEDKDWIRITVPGLLPNRNRSDNPSFIARPLRNALAQYLRENPMERFCRCAVCIVHNYDISMGMQRVRDYDNIETKRYLDVIESMLLTNDSGLLCTVLQTTKIMDRDTTEFYLMLPETLPKWWENNVKTHTTFCT